jgi:hypothetical protein
MLLILRLLARDVIFTNHTIPADDVGMKNLSLYAGKVLTLAIMTPG